MKKARRFTIGSSLPRANPSILQCKAERGSLAGLRFDPDAPAVLFDDPFTNGQPDAGTGNVFAMQSLEDAEDAFAVLRIDADAVVAHLNQPVVRTANCRNMNFRRHAGPGVFDPVADEVLEQLNQLDVIGVQTGQFIVSD